jgi:predicted AlkP superfamily pyrophosphatase or phosphodiesterase
MRAKKFLCALAAATTATVALSHAAAAAPVLMISIDGLRPADVLDADQRGLKLPNLRKLAAEGMYATGVRNALPTVTYPNHTTLVTGVWPAKHGIAGNTTFDPLGQNLGGWYWYASDIKVPTLWDAAHKAGRKTASVYWPVTVGDAAIDYDIPELWRAHIAEDAKLLKAVSTPGLVDQLEAATGLKLAQMTEELPQNNEARTSFTVALIKAKKPAFTTLHLAALDHAQHGFGPDTPQSKAVLEQLDAMVGRLVATARAAEPGIVIAVVSDHGFAPLQHAVNLEGAFVDAGLMSADEKTHRITSWQAAPWGGASAAVVLAKPDDPALKAKVAEVLARLATNPELGIASIVDAGEIARMGGTPQASFWVDFKPGYEAGGRPGGPMVGPSGQRGTHGYFPDHPEMRATFILAGPGVPKKGAIGEIDMRDIAPTVAKVLQVQLPSADGKPLF